MRIEIHVLQNFAPSNLNRDDTGSPKDADFGGHRRARISSQCQKRAIRVYFEKHQSIPAERLATRTKRLVREVADQLERAGKERVAAKQAATAAITTILPKTAADNNGEQKTPYLVFLGYDEISRLVALVTKHWDALSAPPPAPAPQEPAPGEAAPTRRQRGRRGAAQQDTAPERHTVPTGFEKEMKAILNGGKAADLALFGRMLADLPEQNVDAACQVAHAISTNKIHSMEMDYYTAVDDLKPDDTAGADMIGTVEFNSACYYRYATLDVAELVGGFRGDKKTRPYGLQGDTELARTTTAAFLRAFIDAIPTGKQNSFAAHSKPSLVFTVVRDGPAVSLANAFAKPITPRDNESLVEKSIEALDSHYGRLVGMYGEGGRRTSAVCICEEVKLTNLKDRADSVQQLIDTTVAAAFSAGGAA